MLPLLLLVRSSLFPRGEAFCTLPAPLPTPGAGTRLLYSSAPVSGAGIWAQNDLAVGAAGADLPVIATPGLARGWHPVPSRGQEGATCPGATTNTRYSPRSAAAGAPTSAGAPSAEARASHKPPALGSARAVAAPRGCRRARELGSPHSPKHYPAGGTEGHFNQICQPPSGRRPEYPFYE